MAYKPCQHLELHNGATARKGFVYRCSIVIALPVLPASITKSYGWEATARIFSSSGWRSGVTKEDCAACPLYAPKEAPR